MDSNTKCVTVIIDCKITVTKKAIQTETFDDIVDKVANKLNIMKGINANCSPIYKDVDIIIGIDLEED